MYYNNVTMWKYHELLLLLSPFYSALIVRWAQDVYEFTESQIATVELVTNSTFEVAQVNIQGFPRQIPDGNPNRIPSLVVPGPAFTGRGRLHKINLHCPFVKRLVLFLGYSFNATIERATSPIHRGNFGNAQVARKILRMNYMKEVTVII